MSFAQSEYARKKKTTRREKFLGEMEQVVPWGRLVALIEPHYPAGKRGRPPVGIERMLRIYFLQQWYGLADEALEDTIYDSQAMRSFVGIDLGRESVPDATTLLKFRHLLEAHELTRRIFEEVGALLTERKLLMREGTLVDATIIAAPSSTKNRERQARPRDAPDQEGQPVVLRHEGAHRQPTRHRGWCTASKARRPTSRTSARRTSCCTARRRSCMPTLATPEWRSAPRSSPRTAGVEWRVAAKRSKIKEMPESWIKDLSVRFEKLKAQTRALVEHPFHIIKNLFKHRKARYRGLRKNTAQLHILFALANLVSARRALLSVA